MSFAMCARAVDHPDGYQCNAVGSTGECERCCMSMTQQLISVQWRGYNHAWFRCAHTQHSTLQRVITSADDLCGKAETDRIFGSGAMEALAATLQVRCGLLSCRTCFTCGRSSLQYVWRNDAVNGSIHC